MVVVLTVEISLKPQDLSGQKGLRLCAGKRTERTVCRWSINIAGTGDFFPLSVVPGPSFTFLCCARGRIHTSEHGHLTLRWERTSHTSFSQPNGLFSGLIVCVYGCMESLGENLQIIKVPSSWNYKLSWLAFWHFSEVKPASFSLKEDRHLELKHSLATGEEGTSLQHAYIWNLYFWEGYLISLSFARVNNIWYESGHSAGVMIRKQNDHLPGGISVCKGNNKMGVMSGFCAT